MTAWASIVVGFLTLGLLTGLIERVRQPGAREGRGARAPGRWAESCPTSSGARAMAADSGTPALSSTPGRDKGRPGNGSRRFIPYIQHYTG